MTKLHLAPGLELPVDVVTQKLAFLGRTGSGKTYAATKAAELMLEHEAQIVALDPVGLWYGLRIGGTFRIPVFGGLHGDIPLEPTAGAVIADLLIDRGISAVLDVSQFETDRQKATFAAAFGARFFFRKKAAPSAVHVFLEECQEFVPQNPGDGEQQMLHDWTRLAKLGRNFGIGLSLISQRPQEINKKVLNMTECLFAFQMRGEQERKTIKAWSNEKDLDVDIVAELPGLAVGECFVSSPQWLQVEKKVKIAKKLTADVSSTPKVGAAAKAARELTPIDLEQLRDTMAATIEKAKADDPKELRKEIAKLKGELAKAAKSAPPDPAVMQQHIDAGVAAAMTAEWKRQRRLVASLEEIAAGLQRRVATAVVNLDNAIGEQRYDLEAAIATFKTETPAPVSQPVRHASRVAAPVRSEGTAGASARRPVLAKVQSTNGAVTRPQQRLLNALAELEVLGVQQPSRHQLGMVAGYNLTGGSGAQHVADLASLSYVETGNGVVGLTDAGRALSHTDDVPVSLAELHERVLKKLSTGQRKIAEYLISIYPESVSRVELGEAVGYNLTGGAGAQHVADLMTVGAAKIPRVGKVVASDMLFPPGLE